MAELAITALAAMAPAAGAAGATAATAATAGATAGLSAGAAGAAAAAGSGFLTSLQSVLTIGSTVAGLAGTLIGSQSEGQFARSQSEMQASFADLNARADELDAEERALRIRRKLVQDIASNRVAFAASGQDISAGGDIEDALTAEADFETGLIRSAGDLSAAGARAQAASYRLSGAQQSARAGNQQFAAVGRGVGQMGNLAIQIARRGQSSRG